MSIQAIHAAVAAVVAGVVGAPRVHTGARVLRDAGTFKSLFWDTSLRTGRVHGWVVDSDGVPVESAIGTSSTGVALRSHSVTVTGYYQVDDAQTGTTGTTTTELWALTDSICAALRTAIHTSSPLGGAVMNASLPTVRLFGREVVHGVDCHTVIIDLAAIERVRITP